MQRKYNLTYLVFALGLTLLMVSVDAQAKIAFVSDRDGHSKEIYVIDDDGDNPRKLTNSPEEEFVPSWYPDGKHIAFSSDRRGNFDIYVMDANGRNLQNLTNNPFADIMPAWSPDGERIAFASNRVRSLDIYVIDADGQNARNLTNVIFGNDSLPAWFPPTLAVAPAGKTLTMWGRLKRVGR